MEAYGMKINTQKKVMTCKREEKKKIMKIKVQNEKIEEAVDFCYLGSPIYYYSGRQEKQEYKTISVLKNNKLCTS